MILKLGVISGSWELAVNFGNEPGSTRAHFSLSSMFAPAMHLESGPTFPDGRKIWNVHLEVLEVSTTPSAHMAFARSADGKQPDNLFFFCRLANSTFSRLLAALTVGRSPSDVVLNIDSKHKTQGKPAFSIDPARDFRTVWHNEDCPEVPLTAVEFRFAVDRFPLGTAR